MPTDSEGTSEVAEDAAETKAESKTLGESGVRAMQGIGPEAAGSDSPPKDNAPSESLENQSWTAEDQALLDDVRRLRQEQEAELHADRLKRWQEEELPRAPERIRRIVNEESASEDEAQAE